MESEESIIFTIVIGTLMISLLVMIIIVFMVAHNRNMEIKNNALQLAQKTKELEVVRAVLETQEAEREAIANNLHDEIGPLMTALKNDLTMMRYDLDEGILTQEKIKESQEFMKEVIENIRTVSQALSPQFVLKYGLGQGMVQFLNHLSIPKIKVDIHLNDSDYSKTITINAYRVFLEVVNNVMKHEKLSTLQVEGKMNDSGLIQIVIAHDGPGLNQKQYEMLKASSNGMGLDSMSSRLQVLNGEIVYSNHQELAQIKLIIPTGNNEKID